MTGKQPYSVEHELRDLIPFYGVVRHARISAKTVNLFLAAGDTDSARLAYLNARKSFFPLALYNSLLGVVLFEIADCLLSK